MLRVKQQILAGFETCGYTNGLLRENYQYFDGVKDRTVEIVGFSQSNNYNSSTACVAAIDKTRLNETKLEPYQLLGCPVLLVYDDSGLQFWKNFGFDIKLHEEIKPQKFAGFFKQYKKDFSPDSIYRAKTIGRVKGYQLSFANIGGLMGIIEEKEGKYLSELAVRIINSLKTNCKGVKDDSSFNKWLFQAAFWLIGAKILKDKGVEGFKTLKISSADDLVDKVQGHYNAVKKLDISNNVQRKTLEIVAKDIVEKVSSFSHITTESLAYVYENALVSKETRQALGTHATPSWLVNYIVWELIDWIEAIPLQDRFVLEPACGHAPFLTAGAKLLSFPFIYKGKEEDRHKYLREHLTGIDKDSFAEEIARLALTLADIPNSNGWNIQHLDIYEDDILKNAAQTATIFFCNPPFENFTPVENQQYGNTITTGNKAAEVLAKTLPYLPENSVFGIILPQGFLHKKNLANLRKYILDNCELRTICNLPDNVFAKAGHLSTILLGRKVKSKKKINYLNVTKANLEKFKNTYRADEELVNKDIFYQTNFSFRIPKLKEIWDYCRGYPKFQEFAVIGRGIEYKDFEKSVQKNKFANAVKGFGKFERKADIKIDSLPEYYWLSMNQHDIKQPRYGLLQNVPQIVVNYARSGGNMWRIKGFMDVKGLPVTRNLLVIRAKQETLSLAVIWALINSPFTNAYMHCHCMEKHNMEGILRNMPVPFRGQDLSRLETLVQKYFRFDSTFVLKDEEKLDQKKHCLLEIDAEILRLYDLPPRLEKRLLEFFAGVPRKGVDFKFDSYYPESFDSYIPLRMFISKEFQNSSVENVKKWIENNRTPEVIEAFKIATKV
jgi:type I restriction-modification system DNA methylase subunit